MEKRCFIIDRDMLKSKMVLKHITTKELCELLKITDVSFYNKVNGKREFNESEICNLVSIFGNSIFFDKCCLVKPTNGKEEKQ